MNRRHALAIAAASGLIVLAGAAAVGANTSMLGTGDDNVGNLSPLQAPAQSPAANPAANPATKPSEITVVVDPRSGSVAVATDPTTPAAPSVPAVPRAEPRVTAPAPVAPAGTTGSVVRTDDSLERSEDDDDRGPTDDRSSTDDRAGTEYEGRDDDD